MTIKYIQMFPFLAVVLLGCLGNMAASAQTADIAGTWVLTRADKILPDGTRVADYGESPHGLVLFTADGFYSVQIYRADRPRFVSGDKLKGTAEEYQQAFLGTSVHFGRYNMDLAKHTITFYVDRSSFPNQDDSTQVRPYDIDGDELSWKVAARPDGSVPVTVLRRVRTGANPQAKRLD